jgi:hypothetical protein
MPESPSGLARRIRDADFLLVSEPFGRPSPNQSRFVVRCTRHIGMAACIIAALPKLARATTYLAGWHRAPSI